MADETKKPSPEPPKNPGDPSIASAPEKGEAVSPPPPPAEEKKTVLVIDDKAPIRNILKQHVEKAGYAALEADGGDQALAVLGKKKVDCLLVDIMMPKMDGYSLVSRIRQDPAYVRVPIIMVTAKGMKEDVVQAIRVGANDYIVKPFTKETVLAKIGKYIGSPKVATAPPAAESKTEEKTNPAPQPENPAPPA
jgi:CheY-like chemotaxis protein